MSYWNQEDTRIKMEYTKGMFHPPSLSEEMDTFEDIYEEMIMDETKELITKICKTIKKTKNKQGEKKMSNEMYYQTLDNSGIKYPNGKVNLYQVEHSFEINYEWIYEMMMNDKDVVNSKFYELIKDKSKGCNGRW